MASAEIHIFYKVKKTLDFCKFIDKGYENA